MPDKEAIEKVPPSTVNQNNFFGNSLSNNFFGPLLNPAQLAGQQPALPVFSTDNFVNGNLPNFDAQYQVNGPVPKTGTLFITHKIFLNFPANMTQAERTTFETDFKKSINDVWSNKHLLTLNNPGFSSYQCKVDVTALVVTDKKDAHTVIDVIKPGEKEKRFRPRVSGINKEADSETTHTGKLDFRDPSEGTEQTIFKPVLLQDVGPFGFDSAKLNNDCNDDIQTIKDFINTIPKKPDPNDPVFSLHYVGHASSEGNEGYNRKLSQKRIDAVDKELVNLNGLSFTIGDAAGEDFATADEKSRKVTVGVFTNDPEKTKQNTAAHEFGHMIGLGDEYEEPRPGADIPDARKKYLGDKPTHYDAIEILVDKAAADETLIQNSGNIMSRGNTVTRGHYAFFVGAIEIMTRNELPALPPTEKMHWKVK